MGPPARRTLAAPARPARGRHRPSLRRARDAGTARRAHRKPAVPRGASDERQRSGSRTATTSATSPERGLLLVPSAFVWPDPVMVLRPAVATVAHLPRCAASPTSGAAARCPRRERSGGCSERRARASWRASTSRRPPPRLPEGSSSLPPTCQPISRRFATPASPSADAVAERCGTAGPSSAARSWLPIARPEVLTETSRAARLTLIPAGNGAGRPSTRGDEMSTKEPWKNACYAPTDRRIRRCTRLAGRRADRGGDERRGDRPDQHHGADA